MRKSWNRLSSLAQLRFLPGLASDAGLRGRPCRVSIQVQGFRFFGRRARQHPNPPPPELINHSPPPQPPITPPPLKTKSIT